VFRLYSKGCEYAIRALVYAVQKGGQDRFQAAEVCRQVEIPEYFTRKIFQALVQGGFLNAVRGPGGGYVLTRPPDEIAILDVVYAVDGRDTFDHCVMGLHECSDVEGCPLHNVWSEGKARLLERLGQTTLQDVVDVAAGSGAAEGVEPEAKPAGRKNRRGKR
jgi:Rrf2 family iron-sulfur cluster assembly transcriptional regulator